MTYDGRKEEEETLLSEIAPFEVPLPPNGELGSAHSPMCTVQCSALICGALKCTAHCTAPVPAASPSVEYAAVGSTFVVPSLLVYYDE